MCWLYCEKIRWRSPSERDKISCQWFSNLRFFERGRGAIFQRWPERKILNYCEMDRVGLKKLSVQIDHRAGNRVIRDELEESSGLFDCRTTRLKSGSILLENQILFERKTLPDFLEAIKSGDLFQEAQRLVHSGYPHPPDGVHGSTHPAIGRSGRDSPADRLCRSEAQCQTSI